MPVLVEEQRYAHFDCGIEHDAVRCAHRGDERLGDLQLADLLRLPFDEDNARGLEARKPLEHLALEPFLRRLRQAGKIAQDRAAVRGELLEIENLRAGSA